eukprot:10868300-Heterocapsa_arctica.AAC.1
MRRLLGTIPVPLTLASILPPLLKGIVGHHFRIVVKQPCGQQATDETPERTSLPDAPALPDLPVPGRPPLLPADPPAADHVFFLSRLGDNGR